MLVDKQPEKDSAEALIPIEVLEDINKDIDDLELLENVFDKRITDKDVQKEIANEREVSNSRLLMDKKDVEVKTELNDKEIGSIAKILLVAERYNVPILNDYVQNVMILKISRNRRGRGEFIQGLHAEERREQPPQSMLSKLFGGFGGGS